MKTLILFCLLFSVTVFMVPCKTSTKESAAPLEGTDWSLMELNKQPPMAVEPRLRTPTLKLDPAMMRASGTSGINRYSGSYKLEGDQIKFGALMGTRMGGPSEAMAQERPLSWPRWEK
jgi:heat shock protein HslJ